MSKTQAGCKMQNEDRRRFTLSLLFALRSPRFTLTCLRDAIASIGHLEVAQDRGKPGQSSSPQRNSNCNWTLHPARLPLKREISSVTLE